MATSDFSGTRGEPFAGSQPTFLFDSSRGVRSDASGTAGPQEGQRGVIPMVGLGTATLTGQRCIDAVGHALSAGYRHLDTALLYGNQNEVGAALKAAEAAGVCKREEVFITSKVAFFPEDAEGVWMYKGGDNLGAQNRKSCEAASIDLCLEQLSVDSVDLMLIHNPAASAGEYSASCVPHFFELSANAGKDTAVRPAALPDGDPLRPLVMDARRAKADTSAAAKARATEARARAWRALEDARAAGKCRFIGVSNYCTELLLEMKSYARVLPAVNQLELHPRFASPRLRQVAAEMGVVLVGYGSGTSVQIEHSSVVRDIAAACSAADGASAGTAWSPTQVVLAWTLQRGVAVIPRSGDAGHIRANLAVLGGEGKGEGDGEDGVALALSDAQLAALDALDQNYPYYWCPKPNMDTL